MLQFECCCYFVPNMKTSGQGRKINKQNKRRFYVIVVIVFGSFIGAISYVRIFAICGKQGKPNESIQNTFIRFCFVRSFVRSSLCLILVWFSWYILIPDLQEHCVLSWVHLLNPARVCEIINHSSSKSIYRMHIKCNLTKIQELKIEKRFRLFVVINWNWCCIKWWKWLQ